MILPAVFTLHLSGLRDHTREWVTEQTEGFLGRPVVRMNGSSVFILFLLLESDVVVSSQLASTVASRRLAEEALV